MVRALPARFRSLAQVRNGFRPSYTLPKPPSDVFGDLLLQLIGLAHIDKVDPHPKYNLARVVLYGCTLLDTSDCSPFSFLGRLFFDPFSSFWGFRRGCMESNMLYTALVQSPGLPFSSRSSMLMVAVPLIRVPAAFSVPPARQISHRSCWQGSSLLSNIYVNNATE